jgi:ERF superfamily
MRDENSQQQFEQHQEQEWREEMQKSESIKELAGALSKAQGEFAGAVKDTANPFFKSKYADLESCVSAIKAPLVKHGLSFVQVSHNQENSASVETIIMHSSGEWLSAGLVAVPVTKSDAQGYGSAMTYARRYSLSAAFGIAPEDDDGNAAAKAKPEKQQIKEIVQNTTDANFDKEVKAMRDCGSLAALQKVWGGFDRLTQHALADTKEKCKLAIINAETAADVPQ